MQIITRRAWLYREGSRHSAKDTEALFGHRFAVVERNGGWVYGQLLSPVLDDKTPGYVGWIKQKNLGPEQAATHRVTALSAPLFRRADIKSRVKKLLPMGAVVTAPTVKGDFVKCDFGYIHARHVAAIKTDYASDFVDVAARYLGRPYIWAGISSDGLDCSGLVQSALRATGRDAPRDADMQEATLGDEVADAGNTAAYKRGDLIFWPGHVGIMIDAQTLLHANAYHMMVAGEPLTTAVERIGAPRCVRRL